MGNASNGSKKSVVGARSICRLAFLGVRGSIVPGLTAWLGIWVTRRSGWVSLRLDLFRLARERMRTRTAPLGLAVPVSATN